MRKKSLRSCAGAVRGGRLQLDLPLENAGARGGGFGLGHMAAVLQRNGERRVGERIVWREHGERERGSDGLLVASSVAQGAHQSVMRFNVFRVELNGAAKSSRSADGIAALKQAQARVSLCVGCRGASLGHGILRITWKGWRMRRRDAMKSFTEYLVFETRKRREMVHITDRVEEIVRKSGVRDGLCFVSPMHITAAIYVNDLESGLIEDIGKWLEELAPARPDYKHHQTGEDNGDAHLKSLLLHHETTLPVTNGRLDLGTWQRVFYAEFDGQRRKRVIVKVLGVE